MYLHSHVSSQLLLIFCVDFSFCWLNLEIKLVFSGTEQLLYCRQAFIHYCGPHQVWKRTKKLHLIWVLTGSLSMLRQAGGWLTPWGNAASQEVSIVLKAVLSLVIPRKVVILPTTQAILAVRQVTGHLLPRQLGTQPGLAPPSTPRQTVLLPSWIVRFPRQPGAQPGLGLPRLPRQTVILPRQRVRSPRQA